MSVSRRREREPSSMIYNYQETAEKRKTGKTKGVSMAKIPGRGKLHCLQPFIVAANVGLEEVKVEQVEKLLVQRLYKTFRLFYGKSKVLTPLTYRN